MSTLNTLHSKLDTMDCNELRALVANLAIDSTFNLINRHIAKLFYNEIASGKTLIMIDLANMHGLNHEYGMNNADNFINNVLDYVRHSDLWVRWGSDEFVVVLDRADVVDYISILDRKMQENNLYAVYAHVTTSNSLTETINRADDICMAAKKQLEKFGLKAGRNEQYTRLTSTVVTE